MRRPRGTLQENYQVGKEGVVIHGISEGGQSRQMTRLASRSPIKAFQGLHSRVLVGGGFKLPLIGGKRHHRGLGDGQKLNAILVEGRGTSG